MYGFDLNKYTPNAILHLKSNPCLSMCFERKYMKCTMRGVFAFDHNKSIKMPNLYRRTNFILYKRMDF